MAALFYPLFGVAKIKTPIRHQCAEADFNVPRNRVEQVYAALKRARTPTKFVVFPGENHTLETQSYLEVRLCLNLVSLERWLPTC